MKTMILNRVSGKTSTIYVPTTATLAATFASTFLEGEYQVLEFVSETGSDVETSAYDVNMMVKNTTTGDKSYISMLVKSNKTEEDIFSAVIGLTINDVVVDEAFITSMRLVSFA